MLNQRAVRGAAVAAVVAIFAIGIAGNAQAQQCGPMDVVFVIDNTGTMDPVNREIQNQLAEIADAVVQASSGDYQFGLISAPENDVNVLLSLEQGNRAALDTAVDDLSNVSSCGLAAAWDEGLNAAVNGLGPRSGTSGAQTGTFNAAWRPNATKIIIVVTDTDPGGFECDFQPGVGDTRVHDLGLEAAALGIRVTAVFVPTNGGAGGGTRDPELIKDVLEDLAATSQGLFYVTKEDASDLAEIVVDIVENCGGGAGGTTTNLVIDPMELLLTNNETGSVRIINLEPAGFGNMTVWTVENIDGSPTSFTASFHERTAETEGTEEIEVRITAGPDTPQGTHLVIVKASREGAPDNFAVIHVVVDCRPPFFLGTPGNQPLSQTVSRGASARLRANPTGDGVLRYQWYRGPSGSTAFPIAGATTAELDTGAINEPSRFWVRVSNACGSRDSATAVVTPTN